jgi:hypothetical protein
VAIDGPCSILLDPTVPYVLHETRYKFSNRSGTRTAIVRADADDEHDGTLGARAAVPLRGEPDEEWIRSRDEDVISETCAMMFRGMMLELRWCCGTDASAARFNLDQEGQSRSRGSQSAARTWIIEASSASAMLSSSGLFESAEYLVQIAICRRDDRSYLMQLDMYAQTS